MGGGERAAGEGGRGGGSSLMCMFASTDVNVWRVLLSAELACISSVGRCCTERQNKELMTSR